MPFMKGRAALRRTIGWLEKGEIVFRNNVRILAMNYNPTDEERENKQHTGLGKFVFWHLPQLKYKNPAVQCVTFNNMTPTPWIKAYLDDDREIVIDCDSRSRQDIHDHLKNVLGKTHEQIKAEEKEEASILKNPSNFGQNFNRHCICEIPGQVPCPGWEELPKHMRGKYTAKVRAGELSLEDLMEESKQQVEDKQNKQPFQQQIL